MPSHVRRPGVKKSMVAKKSGGIFTPQKISKKRQKEIKRSPVKAMKLLGTDPGLFAQEFVRGTGSGSLLFGFPKSRLDKHRLQELKSKGSSPDRRGKDRK